MTDRIALVAFDLDGTAVPMMGSVATPFFCDTLRAAADLGVVCAVFTGRALVTVPYNLRSLDSVGYLCCANGASIIERASGAVLYAQPMPEDRCLEVLALLSQYDVVSQVFTSDTVLYPQYVLDHPECYQLADHHLTAIRQGVVTGTPDLAEYVRKNHPTVEKVNIVRAEGALRQELIEKIAEIPDLDTFFSGGVNLEINHRKTNKGTALNWLADYLGIPMSQVMAIGDHHNDNSMIAAAGLGVVMGDGAPETQAIADYITASQAEDGAALAIRKFLLDTMPGAFSEQLCSV